MLLTLVVVSSYVVIGALAGIVGGLLGLGGGIITVPCLFVAFKYLGYPQADLMHLAIGTSLAAMVFNTLSATWAHHRKKAVVWDIVKKMTPGYLVGSLIGALTASSLSSIILELIFGSFLCALGVYFLLGKSKVKPHYQLPSAPILNVCSIAIGAISNILGIGGGTMTVPLLSYFKVNDKSAIGTSSAASFILSFFGAVTYFILGREDVSLSSKTGYIDLIAFIVVGTVSFLLAPYGAKLAHDLPSDKVRKVFAFVVIITGLSMLFF